MNFFFFWSLLYLLLKKVSPLVPNLFWYSLTILDEFEYQITKYWIIFRSILFAFYIKVYQDLVVPITNSYPKDLFCYLICFCLMVFFYVFTDAPIPMCLRINICLFVCLFAFFCYCQFEKIRKWINNQIEKNSSYEISE